MTRKRAIFLALFVFSLALLFRGVIVKLVLDWWNDPNYSHGLLVVPLVLWFMWHERDRFVALPVQPSWLGLLAIGTSLLLLDRAEPPAGGQAEAF